LGTKEYRNVQTSCGALRRIGGKQVLEVGELAILGDTPYHPVQPVAHIIAEEWFPDN